MRKSIPSAASPHAITPCVCVCVEVAYGAGGAGGAAEALSEDESGDGLQDCSIVRERGLDRLGGHPWVHIRACPGVCTTGCQHHIGGGVLVGGAQV